MSINDWKEAVCEISEAYEHSEDIAFHQERKATTNYIAALQGLCAAYETVLAKLKGRKT